LDQIVLYALQIGLCLILVLTRNENTKDSQSDPLHLAVLNEVS
jgi:hypothetical protein